MSRHIQIGSGSRILGVINLLVGTFVLILLLLFAFSDEAIAIAAVIFSIIYALNAFRSLRRHYIFLQGHEFVVYSLFGLKARIDTSAFDKVRQDPITIPLSNMLVVHFKNGRRYRVEGGTKSAHAVDA